jgi:electron transfer flavoprotein beta subunit
MNIVTCIKAVPSTTEVRMDPVTNTIVRDGRQSVVNPFDSAALEVAVGITERLGGQVTALSMGIPDTVRLLRDCLARGANGALLLSDRAFAGADTLATSYALSCGIAAIERSGEQVDLIVCGKMAVDGDTAQIGPELAAVRGVPCVANVCEILEVRPDGLRVKRAVDGAREVVDVPLPAVVTVEKDVCLPRMPSISGVRYGEAGPVAIMTAAQVGADPARIGLAGSPTQVVRSFTPERSDACTRIEGTPTEQAEALNALVQEMAL